MNPLHQRTNYLIQGALVAALYAALTLAIAPIGFGVWQCRVSEAFCVLPYFMPAAVPGLFIGCLLANFLSGAILLDVVFGSLATLLAAVLSYRIRKAGWSRWLIPLPAVVCNAFVVAWLLAVIYPSAGMIPLEEADPFWFCVLTVGAGQILACYGLGMPLWALLNRYQHKLFG